MSSVTPLPRTSRIASIDQYRGFAIFGMIMVNYLGQFSSITEFFKHHSDYMTFADIIAPLFLFVVGMGFRLSILRNVETKGRGRALVTAFRRYCVLTLVGILYYAPLDWHGWWDALVDIGLAGILALPFISFGARTRIFAAFGYLGLYQLFYSVCGYGPWVMGHSFDGGPLGPISWVFPLLMGTLAYDLIVSQDRRKIVNVSLAWGIGLSILGWALHAQWPTIKAAWPFSQQGMSAPYPLFATGLCFLMYMPFHFLCDLRSWRFPTLLAVGANPLVMYLLHAAYNDIHGTVVPKESGVAIALLGFAGLYGMCYAVARYLYKNKMFIKI